MNNVINSSRLCEIEKCLTNLKGFSKFRYFKFHRSTPGDSIFCQVRVNVSDEWSNIDSLSSRGTIKSFTKFVPSLANTPLLLIRCPDGENKVTECIEAVESRITSVEKVDALLKLRDDVFKWRTEDFH